MLRTRHASANASALPHASKHGTMHHGVLCKTPVSSRRVASHGTMPSP
jgi:hypothetical protein